MIGTMTNHTKPTLLISNVLPARPGDEAYNNICMRLWDRLLQAALPTWNVIREYAQEDGAEGAALRAQALGEKGTRCQATDALEAIVAQWVPTL